MLMPYLTYIAIWFIEVIKKLLFKPFLTFYEFNVLYMFHIRGQYVKFEINNALIIKILQFL